MKTGSPSHGDVALLHRSSSPARTFGGVRLSLVGEQDIREDRASLEDVLAASD